MKPLTIDDKRIEGVPFREFYLEKDVLSALKLAKKKIKNQTLTFKKDVFEILDECFQIQEGKEQ